MQNSSRARSMASWLFHAVTVSLVTCTTCAANAQVARTEIHAIRSTTLTDDEFLRGQKDGKPVTVAGQLRLPRPGSDRLPAVILLHASGGIGGFITNWEQYLNAMGVATFLVDSWASRPKCPQASWVARSRSSWVTVKRISPSPCGSTIE